MSDFCWRPKSPLLSYLICMPGTVGSRGTTRDMDYWEDRLHLVTFPSSIMVIIPHNLIKHTPAWLPTCKTDSLIQCPYFCSYCGMAQHTVFSADGQQAEMKGPYIKWTCREREWDVLYNGANETHQCLQEPTSYGKPSIHYILPNLWIISQCSLWQCSTLCFFTYVSHYFLWFHSSFFMFLTIFLMPSQVRLLHAFWKMQVCVSLEIRGGGEWGVEAALFENGI